MGFVASTFSTNHLQYRAELDRTIFSLDKAERLVELKKQRDYIIKRLNADFQKTWFGRNSSGVAVDLEDMTYAEVVRRWSNSCMLSMSPLDRFLFKSANWGFHPKY